MRPTLFLAMAIIFAADLRAQIPAKALQYRMLLRAEVRRQWGLNMPYDAIPVAAGTIHQESGWDPRAQSPYAKGIAQFTGDTWSWVTTADPSVGTLGDVWSAPAAIRAMAYYHRWLWARISPRPDQDRWAGVLSSYNGGLGWFQRDQKKAGSVVWVGQIETANAGRSAAAFAENRNYVLRIWTKWRLLYAAY